MLSAAEVAKKWADRSAAAGPAIQAGVMAMRPEDNPMAKAAAQEEKWARRCQEAAQANRFSRGCMAVSMEEWRGQMIRKGIPNFQNGIASGKTKMEGFMMAFLPYVEGARRQLPPRGTLRDNINRATRMIELLAEFKGRARGSSPAGPAPFPPF